MAAKAQGRPESELPGCPDITVWWKSTQQPDASRVWSKASLLLCQLVTHAPVGCFRAFTVSSDVWGSSASHTRVSTPLSLQLWLLFGCQSYFAPADRGRGSSSFSDVKKAQEALASRLPCISWFLLVPKLPGRTVATSCCLIVVEALTLKALFISFRSPRLAFYNPYS